MDTVAFASVLWKQLSVGRCEIAPPIDSFHCAPSTGRAIKDYRLLLFGCWLINVFELRLWERRISITQGAVKLLLLHINHSIGQLAFFFY